VLPPGVIGPSLSERISGAGVWLDGNKIVFF
jgi:hypothetical protein